MKGKPTENHNKEIASSGERSVSVGGSVSHSNIHTGDNVYNIYNQENQTRSVVLENILVSKIENLSTDLSKEKAARLEDLREMSRAGRVREAFEGVRLLRSSSNWDAFEPPIRASVLRALAAMTLGVNGKDGIDDAKIWADEARRTDPAPNDDVLRARIKTFEDGFEAALEDFAKINSPEAYNLWLNCLLNTGRIEEVITSRENPPAGVTLNAESRRFYALALLAVKKIDEAETEIKKAQDEKPDWQHVRFTASIIDYYSAISPTALPPHLVPYPRPFPFAWTKIDDESQGKLNRAAQVFLELSGQFDAGSREERECWTWHFACLANSLGRQPEAIETGRGLLEKEPDNLQTLSWFLFRGYEFDTEKSLELLERKEQKGNASIEDLLGLVGIYLKLARPEDALGVIERKKDVFAAAGETNLWRYWRGTSLLYGDKPAEAFAEEREITNDELKRLLKTNILSYKAEKLGEWKSFIEYLRERYKKDKDSQSFLTLYEIKVQKAEDEKFIADHADSYCEKMQTASAVDLAAQALWKIGRVSQCLDLLNKYESLFPQNKLPVHLRQLKIHALIKSDVKKALEEAEALAKEDNSVGNLALLMDVHLVKGDLTGLQAASRKLLQRPDAEAQDLLRAAHLVQVKDANSAAKFLKRAVETGVPDDDPELVVFAQSIASKLGLEEESRELMGRMMQQSEKGRGILKRMSIRQVLKDSEKRQQSNLEIDQKHGAGEIPLHLLPNRKNMSLAKRFLWLADKIKESGDIHRNPRIFTRHGARILFPPEQFANSKNWNPHLDITSLLLAHKLGILDKLEKTFKPLRISRHAVTALVEQRDELRPHQKSQLDNQQTIADLFDKKKIKLADGQIPPEILDEIRRAVEEFQTDKKKNRKEKKHRRNKKKRIVTADAGDLERQLGDRLDEIAHAINENGFAAGFLPLNCYGTDDYAVLRLPESLGNKIVNCRAIVESLRAYNRISEEKYRQAIRSLGQEANPHAQVSPLPRAKIFMMSDVAGVLAGAGVLAAVCENFEVFISESALDEARNTIRYYEEMDELGTQLDELISRINEGLDDGTYEFIRVPDEKAKKEKFSDRQFGQDIKSPLDLLLYKPKEWDVISIDDRVLTRHAIRQENGIVVPIIGINELLLALRQNDELDEQEYYNLLLELRRGNFRYIPINEDEILYHLNLASIENEHVEETEALSVLRRYHASCLLDKDFLQIAGAQFSEMPFIARGTESIANALVAVWKDENLNQEIAKARADWIFENLYTGMSGSSHLWKLDVALNTETFPNDKVNELAFDICNLLMRGLILEGDSILLKETQKPIRFFDWLNDRILTTRAVSTPEVTKAIARQIKERFKTAHAQERGASPAERAYFGAFMGRFFLDLPQKIATEIVFDQEMLDWLRVKVGDAVTTASGVNFNAREYWGTVEECLRGEKTISLKAADSEKEYFFALEPDECESDSEDHLFPTIKITDADGNKIDSVQDPSFGVLDADVTRRLKSIYKLRSWFDCDEEKFKRIADEIARIEDSSERAARFYKVRESSMVSFYAGLEERFRNREVVTWQELMPPSAENLAGYFGLPTSTDGKNFIGIWHEAAESLLGEEEITVALSRLCCLPVRMPEAVVERFLALPGGVKVETLRKLSPIWASPVQLLHLLNLAMRALPSENKTILEITESLVAHLYEESNDDETDEFAAFSETLSFVNDEFHFWAEKSNLPTEIGLAVIWGHASRLYNIQRVLGMEPKNIVASLGNRRESYFYQSIARDLALWNDCAHPRRFSRTAFLTHAAANLFAGVEGSVLESLKIPERIRKEIFPKDEEEDAETSMPATSLLNDPTLCSDKLQSLFGGDRFEAISPVTGAENIEILKTDNLKQSVKTFLERMIENPAEVKSWILVYAVITDLPIYEDLREICFESLKKITPNSLFEEGIENPAFILFAAASQVSNYDDEGLRAMFRQNVIEMLKEIVRNDEFAENIEILATLMDAALALSYERGDPAKSNEDFAELAEKISFEWKDFAGRFGYAFANTFWNIALAEGENWRRFNLNLRAITD